MTIYRILPDGRRRTLPDGTPRTVALAGPAGSAVVPESLDTAATLTATVSGVASATVAAMGVVFALAATPSVAGGVEPLNTNFALQASPSAVASVVPAPMASAFDLSASPTGTITAALTPLATAFGLTASPGSVMQPSVIPAPMPSTFTLAAKATGAVTAPVTPLTISMTLQASPSVSTAQRWRSVWLNAYYARQTVLNAIDANNRLLAKQAGIQAKATADALVITNTNVAQANERITAEALRTTLLTAEVQNVQAGSAQAVDALRVVVEQNGTNISSIGTQVTSLRNAVDDPATGLAANAQGIATVDNRVSIVDGKVEAQSQAITGVSAQAASADAKATGAATATSALTARTDIIEGQVISQGQAITAVTGAANNAASTAATALTAANNAADAVTNVQVEVQAPFTSDYGWEFVANHRGFSSSGANLVSFPPTSESGATVVQATNDDPQLLSPTILFSGGDRPIVRAMVRRRNVASWDGQLYWSTPFHGFSGSYVVTTAAPPVGEWAVVEFDLSANSDWRSSNITRLRFDFASQNGSLVDVKWIAIGAYGQGRTAQATQTLYAGVDSVSGRLNATYGFALSVDGRVIGMRAANDGAIGRIDFVGDAVGFFPPSGAATGLELTPGNTVIRQFGAGWQRIQSAVPFGPDALTYFYGPNVGIAAASKAVATKWEDAAGNSWTGGVIEQGVRRYFNSNTTLSPTNIVTTGVVGSNGKPVAVTGVLQYSAFQAFAGINNFTPGGGATRAVVVLERAYQGQGFVEIARRTISGGMELTNGTDGDASVYWSISGDVRATDAASTLSRTYRTRVLSIETQAYNRTGSGGPQGQEQRNQYTSIESME